jgi:hypothetical protein
MYTAIFGLSPSAPVDYSRGDLQVAAFTDGRPVFVVEDPAPGITWERKR